MVWIAIKEFLQYSYYDTPEGENCFNKTFYCAKMTTLMGTGVAYYDMIAYRHLVPGWTKTGFFIRGVGKIAPFTACGAFFGASACLMHGFAQNQQTYWPYVLAAGSTGFVWGALHRNYVYGWSAAAILAAIAWNKKHSRLNNYRIFTDTALLGKYHMYSSNLWFRELDYSMMGLNKWVPKAKTYYFDGAVDPLPLDRLAEANSGSTRSQ